MKTLVASVLFSALFLCYKTNAQDCKFFKEGTIKGSGEPFKETRNTLVKTYPFGMRKEGSSKFSCSMEISLPGTNAYIITPKDVLVLTLENEEVIELTPEKNVAPEKKAAMNGITSLYTPSYSLSKEMLQKLAASPVVKVRISMDKPIEGPARKAEAQEIMKLAACLLKD
jgi:hypothetical protein